LPHEVSDELFLKYVGRNPQYYLKRKKLFDTSTTKVSWNTAAAFLGVLWMWYRGMWLYGCLTAAVIITTSILTVFVGTRLS
jgi:hypothetical protein